MSDNFNFEPKRILKHKNHITLNDGPEMEETVQHLEKRGDEFVELRKNEAARKYGSKKLVRDLDFSSRDGIEVNKDSGLGLTPDWFDNVIPTIDWENHETFLYELDHLWVNMFFVRELFGEEGTGREQIIQLTEGDTGLRLQVLCELDYISDPSYKDYDKSEADGFIQVEINSEEKSRSGTGGREFDTDITFRHTLQDVDESVTAGLREVLTGICLKHGHTDEQVVFKLEENKDSFTADILNKDFTVTFGAEEFLDSEIGAWVRELFYWDGCPLEVNH